MTKCKCGSEDNVGKNGKCKSCNTEYMREYRAKNRDKIKAYQREYDAKYYKANKDQILADKKEYYQENKEEILEDRKEYHQQNKNERTEYGRVYYQDNRGRLLENAKIYAENNSEWIKEYHNAYYKERRLTDINFRIKTNISANIGFYLRSNGLSKDNQSTLKYLPYTIDELKTHLEKQFEPWMSWNNYGRYDTMTWDDSNSTTWTWQIDHITPHSTFNYSSMEDEGFTKCWALSNLRPYSSKQNFLDGIRRIRHN